MRIQTPHLQGLDDPKVAAESASLVVRLPHLKHEPGRIGAICPITVNRVDSVRRRAFRLSFNFNRPRHLTARAKSALAGMTGCDRYSATPNLLGTQAREPFSDGEARRAHRVHAPAARPGDNATARNARAA